MWRPLVRTLLLLVSPGLVSPGLAETRVALVIGNSDYRNVSPLPNPANDARLIAQTLSSLGFRLVGDGPQLDLDKPHFDLAVQAFGKQLVGADIGLFYYAGHGIQVRGTNYLVPVSANPVREADADFQMVDAGLVLKQMEGAGTRLNIIMLDACRNNPFAGQGVRSAQGGLAQIQAPEGTLVSYATQPGNVALDGEDGHSPYTRALVETMQKPHLDVLQAFNQVGLSVKKATGSAQQPWFSSSPIDGAFTFAANETSQIATAAPAATDIPIASTARPVSVARPDFIYPDSDRRLLTAADLNGRSREDMRIARNEILARRGRYFKSPELVAYFGKFAWYTPNTWDPQLTAVETANVDLLDRAENGQSPANDFIIPDSDRRMLTADEVGRLSKQDLRIAKNEIFARRGRYFDAADLKAHFARFAWYAPNNWSPRLTPVEEANVALMTRFEQR
jgi:uncharacterized caspase-like protein